MITPENRTVNLDGLGIAELNAMQNEANEAIQQNSEVVLLSPTGSGQNTGFPASYCWYFKTDLQLVQCLIVVPTRELALQIEQVWRKMSTGFKVTCCYGGHDMPTEIRSLVEPPALIIGTPGRILDHIQRQSFTGKQIAAWYLTSLTNRWKWVFRKK
jgi:superfamily II DNA/RNA helicase